MLVCFPEPGLQSSSTSPQLPVAKGKGSAAWKINKYASGWLSEPCFSSHFQGHLKNGAHLHFLVLSIISVCSLNTGTGAGGCRGLHLSSQRAEWWFSKWRGPKELSLDVPQQQESVQCPWVSASPVDRAGAVQLEQSPGPVLGTEQPQVPAWTLWVMSWHWHSSCPQRPDLLSRFYLLRDPESGLNITSCYILFSSKRKLSHDILKSSWEYRDHQKSGFSELNAFVIAREQREGL